MNTHPVRRLPACLDIHLSHTHTISIGGAPRNEKKSRKRGLISGREIFTFYSESVGRHEIYGDMVHTYWMCAGGGPQFFGLIVPLFLLLLHDVRVVVFIYVVPPAKRMRLQQGEMKTKRKLSLRSVYGTEKLQRRKMRWPKDLAANEHVPRSLERCEDEEEEVLWSIPTKPHLWPIFKERGNEQESSGCEELPLKKIF